MGGGGCSWFKFNNLGLALGMTLKFYSSMAKWLKLKVTKVWGLIPTFIEVTGEKQVGGFLPPSPPFYKIKYCDGAYFLYLLWVISGMEE